MRNDEGRRQPPTANIDHITDLDGSASEASGVGGGGDVPRPGVPAQRCPGLTALRERRRAALALDELLGVRRDEVEIDYADSLMNLGVREREAAGEYSGRWVA